ncbi:hypothetical protein BFJ68_g15650 [Fusarium oxysporum]|uniref:Amidase domain-containing protein n=1 Tax=Fusarium oxysporum TaxID=5507 RepID=A0A420PKS9_FUSOX|nr:hypothetical protein BFJ71_g15317 [Fusarium oxysporum]RKK93133.1 hypothetical protein BFJ68_g15650 [Fusarium oxysporum]
MKAMKIAMRWFALDQVNLLFKFFQDGSESPIADLDAMDPGKFLDPGFVADLRDNSENINISADIHEYREWAKIWREARIDGLLCPASRGSAVTHGEFSPLMYTKPLNLLDFPSSVVPFGKADQTLDSKDGYDASVVDGGPTGFQLVGWRFQDDQTLITTEVIADELKA